MSNDLLTVALTEALSSKSYHDPGSRPLRLRRPCDVDCEHSETGKGVAATGDGSLCQRHSALCVMWIAW